MWWRRRKQEDFRAELDAHLQLEADELRSEGASPGESYAQAQKALGNRTLVEERFYESSPWMWLEQTLRDLRYAVRSLRKDSAFSAVAVLVLALGIGGNVAVFSLVNALLLKPLVIRDPEQVVGCYSVDAHHPDRALAFSYPDYADLRAQNAVFSGLAAHDIGSVMVAADGASRPVPADLISSNFFDTLGAPLFKGRSFTPDEERPDSDPRVVILSYSFWQRIGADPDIVGKTLRLNGKESTVVGVAPEHFTGTIVLLSMDLYLPLGAYSTASEATHGHNSLNQRDNHVLMLVGRLKPGIAQRQADALLAPVAAQLEKTFPGENRDQAFLVRPFSRLELSPDPSTQSDLRTAGVPVVFLLSMAAVVLAIASLNLAGLTLARGNARHREIAIRLAIGANRGRIVRQLATEGFLLACLGGAAGLAVAPWAAGSIFPSLSARMHIHLDYSPRPDIRVVGATLAFCLLSTLIFSLWPAWKISKLDLNSGLKTGAGEELERGRLFSRRNLLVMAQLSLSLMLLSAAGLFLHSGLRAARFDPGFATRQQMLLEVDSSFAGYDEARSSTFFETLLTRLRGIPGVESTALAVTVPFGNGHEAVGMRPAGAPESSNIAATFNGVTPEYFETFGITLLRGRTFYPSETKVAIVDELGAKRLWPGQDPIGKRVSYGTNEVQVVGVSGDVRDGIVGNNTQPPHLYVPFAQYHRSDMNVHLKTAPIGPEAEARLFDQIRREVNNLDSRVAILNLTTISSNLDTGMDFWLIRMGTRLLGTFAGSALLLAVIGLYGVKAYTVARRTREIGIRIAVGAHPSDVLSMILREGLLVAAIGVTGGLILALGLGRFLAGLLYDVRAADVVVLSSAGLLLLAVSALASFVPARRAARIDPMLALRND